ncbi:MAG: hypothetical protein JWO81_2888 [Alphaproteobacteria bacterium]|nr:hypothetical protein [Alphaproteobacteria bacterium]
MTSQTRAVLRMLIIGACALGCASASLGGVAAAFALSPRAHGPQAGIGA